MCQFSHEFLISQLKLETEVQDLSHQFKTLSQNELLGELMF